MTMNILHDMKKVVLDDCLRIDGFDGRRIRVPEINIHHRNAQTKDAQPAQNRLNMPPITLFQANGKEEPAVFIPYRQFPTLRTGCLIFIEMQGRDQFF
jgi:hypothetical protein